MKILDDIEAKKRMISLLSEFDHICRVNNVKYYLACGTLLGAVRGGGFIPWDSDIDIYIPRKEAEKLLDRFQEDDNYFICKHMHHHGKKLYDRIYFAERATVQKDGKIGIALDGFIMENIPKSFGDRIKLVVYESIFLVREMDDMNRGILKNSLLLLVKIVTAGISNKRLEERIINIIKKNRDIEPKDVFVFGWGVFSWKWFKKRTSVRFEGKRYPAPGGYHDYLKCFYGSDYMVPPPVEKRVKDMVEYYLIG